MKEDKNSASIRPAARFFSKLESDFDNLAVPAGSVKTTRKLIQSVVLIFEKNSF